jgi:DNA-directed RNA polymerase specialized sigma24 family protein
MILADTLTSLDEIGYNVPDHRPDDIARVENRVALHQALDTLPTEQQLVIRALFGLGDVMPMDAHEISNKYLMPKSTVYARRDAALLKLRAVLSSEADNA